MPPPGRGSPKRGSFDPEIVTRNCCVPHTIDFAPTDLASFEAKPFDKVESALTNLDSAPRQAGEGAPEAWLVLKCHDGLQPGDEIIVLTWPLTWLLTWLDRARPDVLSVHPRGDNSWPPPGSLQHALSSSPEPIGLHQVAVAAVEGHRMRVRKPRSPGWEADAQSRRRPTLKTFTACTPAVGIGLGYSSRPHRLRSLSGFGRWKRQG